MFLFAIVIVYGIWFGLCRVATDTKASYQAAREASRKRFAKRLAEVREAFPIWNHRRLWWESRARASSGLRGTGRALRFAWRSFKAGFTGPGREHAKTRYDRIQTKRAERRAARQANWRRRFRFSDETETEQPDSPDPPDTGGWDDDTDLALPTATPTPPTTPTPAAQPGAEQPTGRTPTMTTPISVSEGRSLESDRRCYQSVKAMCAVLQETLDLMNATHTAVGATKMAGFDSAGLENIESLMATADAALAEIDTQTAIQDVARAAGPGIAQDVGYYTADD